MTITVLTDQIPLLCLLVVAFHRESGEKLRSSLSMTGTIGRDGSVIAPVTNQTLHPCPLVVDFRREIRVELKLASSQDRPHR